MELLRDRQPGADSKTRSSRVSPCGDVWIWQNSKWAALRANVSPENAAHRAVLFSFLLWPLLRFKFFFFPIKFHVNCFTLSLQPHSLPHLHHINSKTQHFQRPFSVRLWEKKCLKTSLTFRLSLKMTLPSTIACGNIIRPTLNFNWYAVPDSSRGNYHSVHNKSHNKHLEMTLLYTPLQ